MTVYALTFTVINAAWTIADVDMCFPGQRSQMEWIDATSVTIFASMVEVVVWGNRPDHLFISDSCGQGQLCTHMEPSPAFSWPGLLGYAMP